MSFTALSKQILSDAETLDAYISEHKLPPPSLSASGPPRTAFTTPASLSAHSSLLSNLHRLTHITLGPTSPWMGTMSGAYGDALTSAAIYRFRIADHVPLDRDISFEEVAEKTGLSVRDLKGVVRYAMTNFIFEETRPGYMGHTASSRVLKENKFVASLMGMGTDEIFGCLEKELDVLAKHPGSEEPLESAWSTHNSASIPLFAHLTTHHPARASTMAHAIETLGLLFDDSITLSAYPWSLLPPDALIVDVGGGKGLFCRSLAPQHPGFRFIVQDLGPTVAAGRDSCPEELKGRIEYTAHDFFQPQPNECNGADVFFFRAIFHNWPDAYIVRILRNLIPALKPDARIIVHDPHTREAGTMKSLWQDRMTRASNLRMKQFFNSRDRESSEYPALFEEADKRFRVVRNGWHNRENGNDFGPTMALVEAVWEG